MPSSSTRVKETTRSRQPLPADTRGSRSADAAKRKAHSNHQRRPSSSKKATEKESDHTSKQAATGLAKLDVGYILERCKEYDCSRVFEIDLQSHNLQEVPVFLNTFARVRIIDLSCNRIRNISNLDKNLVVNQFHSHCPVQRFFSQDFSMWVHFFSKAIARKDMRELKLYSNAITDISGLEKLKELNNLLLQHNRIKVIGRGLQQLKKLKMLRLDNNLLSSVQHNEIGCCSQITVLDISNNRISDLSALNALSALEELDASNNRLSKLPDLGRCKKLGDLDLSRNQISELSGLRGLNSLLVLRVERNQLTSLTSLGKCKSIQELYVSFNRLSRVEALVNQFPFLETLNISSNALDSLDDVCTLSQHGSLAELSVSAEPEHIFKHEIISCSNNFVIKDHSSRRILPAIFISRYHHEVQKKMPSLHMLDGILLKRPSSARSEAPPPMRPLSASQMLSSRQVEEQLKAVDMEQSSFAESLSSRFSIVRDLFNSLPREPPQTPRNTQQQNVPLEESNQSESFTEDTRPGSRCSSRSKIAEARAFAAAHFQPEGKDNP